MIDQSSGRATQCEPLCLEFFVCNNRGKVPDWIKRRTRLPFFSDNRAALLSGLSKALVHQGNNPFQTLGCGRMNLKDNDANLLFGRGLLLGDAAVEGDEDLKSLFLGFTQNL
jgi:hypothetical protein